MLEYSLDDAEELLSKNKESAEKNIMQIAFDLAYLRDQMTITEVTMARLYNWDVKRRKEKKEARERARAEEENAQENRISAEKVWNARENRGS